MRTRLAVILAALLAMPATSLAQGAGASPRGWFDLNVGTASSVADATTFQFPYTMKTVSVMSVLFGLLLLVAACQPGGAMTQVAGANQGSALPAVASAIENVPVPESAQRSEMLPLAATGGGDDMSFLAAERQAHYVVPGSSSEQLRAWYDEHMPVGEPWQEWAWCERPSQFQRIYHRPGAQPGTYRFLAIMVPSDGIASVRIVQPDIVVHSDGVTPPTSRIAC